MPAPPLIAPRALLLDMDGTLTRPRLDFDHIRANLGIEPGRPILEALHDKPAAEQPALFDRLQRRGASGAVLVLAQGLLHQVFLVTDAQGQRHDAREQA